MVATVVMIMMEMIMTVVMITLEMIEAIIMSKMTSVNSRKNCSDIRVSDGGGNNGIVGGDGNSRSNSGKSS